MPETKTYEFKYLDQRTVRVEAENMTEAERIAKAMVKANDVLLSVEFIPDPEAA